MGNQKFRPYGLYRFVAFLFGLTKFKSIDFLDEHFDLNFKSGSNSIKYTQVMEVKSGGIFFKRFQFICPWKTYTFSGLSRGDCSQLITSFEAAEKNAWEIKLKKHGEILKTVSDWVDQVKKRTNYQRTHVFNTNVTKAKDLKAEIPGKIPISVSEQPSAKELDNIRKFLKNLHGERDTNNREYIPLEIERQKKLFDEIESNPLTEEQRKAVVIDEDSNLVVAAAGSGKTSVIVAKVAWLLEKQLRPPKEILLMAYGRDTRKEMSQRLVEKIGKTGGDVSVHTFHSLGLKILNNTSDDEPSVSKMAQDNSMLENFIREAIQSNLHDKQYRHHMNRWFTEFFGPYASEFDFENYGQYWEFIKKNNIRSLKNEKLRSFEECEIANFLYLNGVDYVYEKDYQYKSNPQQKPKYQPDFYLPDHDIYIEHLGLKGFGRTAPFVNRKQYLKSLRWKRDLHNSEGTTLIETYSCEKSQGVLTENLKEKLSSQGVKFEEISAEKTFEILHAQKQIDPFTKLVSTFLGHFKGSQLNKDKLQELNKQFTGNEAARNNAFIEVFMPIYESYEARLKEDGHVDYHDMISSATNRLLSGEYENPFRYILVDEFQDISVGRSKFLSAIQNSSEDSQLFCVGDDWQAIFRFAGSDINVMKDFGEYFGTFERSDLTTTFRSEEKITEHATNFILQNENQISKEVSATRKENGTSVYVCFEEEEDEAYFENIIKRIVDAEGENANPDILVLGRYNLKNYNRNYKVVFDRLRKTFPKIKLDFKTAHRAKGLEADYVIVLEVISGFFGFPNEKADDHVLNMVLAKRENYPNAEERRLFYVALTRAKKKVFLCTEAGKTSPFLDEIIKSPFDMEILGKEPSALPTCSKCLEGKLILKDSENGKFWGCNNFPYCEYKEQTCPHCKKGYPKLNDDNVLACDFCEQTIVRCPRPNCGGHLQQEKGPHGIFWGCSKFRATGCDYKTNSLTHLENKVVKKGQTSKTLPWRKRKTPQSPPSLNQKEKPLPKPPKAPNVEAPARLTSANEDEKPKKKEPKIDNSWTKKEERHLATLVLLGKKDTEITKTLGRTMSSIKTQKKKLGL